MNPGLKRRIEANPIEREPRVRYTSPTMAGYRIRILTALIWAMERGRGTNE